MPLKTLFSLASLLLTFILYIPYYRGIYRQETKPHLLTWVTWCLLTGLGFVLSYSAGGGWGSFTFALQSLFCLSIVVYALWRREKNITRFDWTVFALVILILVFYFTTKNALLAVVFAATIDTLGYLPTFRKSFHEPYSEPALTYTLAALSWLLSIVAVQVYEPATVLYPVALVFVNLVFVLFLWWRRKMMFVK